jgi:hypothetical protein
VARPPAASPTSAEAAPAAAHPPVVVIVPKTCSHEKSCKIRLLYRSRYVVRYIYRYDDSVVKDRSSRKEKSLGADAWGTSGVTGFVWRKWVRAKERQANLALDLPGRWGRAPQRSAVSPGTSDFLLVARVAGGSRSGMHKSKTLESTRVRLNHERNTIDARLLARNRRHLSILSADSDH